MAIDPADIETLASRGNTYRIMKKYDLALADFDKVLQLNPQDPLIHLSKAQVYEISGKIEQALVYYRNFIRFTAKDNAYQKRNIQKKIKELTGDS